MRARGFMWCPHCKGPHPLGTRICEITGCTLDGALHESRPHPMIGTMFADTWRIVRHLGSGGMGDVFEAEHKRLRNRAAIKLVKSSGPREGFARLQREAELLASLHHPNICKVIDVGEMKDGTPFLVLELLSGQTLASRIARDGPLSASSALDVFGQVLSALHSAHGANVIHRDVKPQNIFLADRVGLPPIPKLLDFGLAKDISGGKNSITARGHAVGTRPYMAPEQLRAERVDARTDVFAVGVTLFEALANEHPFGRTALDVQIAILREEPKVLSTRRPDLPVAVSHVLAQAMAKQPSARFASALAMHSALRHAFGVPSAQRLHATR